MVEGMQNTSPKRKKHKQGFWEQTRSLAGIILLAFLIRTFFYGLYQVPTPSMETTMLVGERFLADKLTVCFSSPKRGEIVTLNQPTFKYSDNWIKNIWQRYVGISVGFGGIDWGPSNWTKRVVGAPGDELKGVLKDGKPVIYIKKNGTEEFEQLDEPYLNKYPVIATFRDSRSPDEYTYRSWDRSVPLNNQPFYQFTKLEVELGRRMAREVYHDRAVKNPGTPYLGHADKKDQWWLSGEIQNGISVLDEFTIKLADDQYWLMGDNREASYDSRAWGPVNQQLIHGKIIFRIWSLDSDQSWWILELIRHPIDFWKKVRWSRCFQRVK